MTQAGYFITVEGGDASGKTTHLPRLVEHLTAVAGREVLATREPGGTELGGHVRDLVLHGDYVAPRAEALLYAADRAHHVAQVVRPALRRGAIVVCDRYVDSSLAYQAEGRQLSRSDVQAINDFATERLVPDLTVLLDVSPEAAAARRHRTLDRLEREDLDFHRRVRERYLELAAEHPERYLVINTEGPLDEVSRDLIAAVSHRLELPAP